MRLFYLATYYFECQPWLIFLIEKIHISLRSFKNAFLKLLNNSYTYQFYFF